MKLFIKGMWFFHGIKFIFVINHNAHLFGYASLLHFFDNFHPAGLFAHALVPTLYLVAKQIIELGIW